VSPKWGLRRQQALALLAEADELERIVNLVGPEALSSSQRWMLESSELIKEAVLQQSALDPVDSFCTPQKQFQLLDLVLKFHDGGNQLIDLGVPVEQLIELEFSTEIKRLKSTVANDKLELLEDCAQKFQASFNAIQLEYNGHRVTS
jgi:V/A-type H+-transporting ATPase subunit A